MVVKGFCVILIMRHNYGGGVDDEEAILDSKKPVLVKMAFLVLLRSLPLSVLPIPSHIENDEICVLASLFATNSCGGTIEPSSSSP